MLMLMLMLGSGIVGDGDEVASARRAANCENAGGEVISDAATAVRVLASFARRMKALRAADSHPWLMIPPLPPVSPMLSSPREERHEIERPGVAVTTDTTVVEENVNVDDC